MTDEKKRSIPEISLDARLLHQKLKTIEIGKTISWEDLSAVIGRDVRAGERGYGALYTARHRVQTDDGAVFEAVHKVGLKRLTDVEIVNSSTSIIDRIHRAAAKGVKRILNVKDFEALPNDLKVRHNAAASLLGAMSHMSQGRSVAKLEGQVENAKGQLPVAKTLEVFK